MMNNNPFNDYGESFPDREMSFEDKYRLAFPENDQTYQDNLASSIIVDELEDIKNGEIWCKIWEPTGYVIAKLRPTDKLCVFWLTDSRQKRLLPIEIDNIEFDSVNENLIIDCRTVQEVHS